MALAARADSSDAALERAYALLITTRPTAINLKWALDEMMASLRNRPREERAVRKGGETVNVLTHCNAGWLAAVDWGPATSPIYQAHDRGVPVHVWVDETRPRNQGASLTACALG